MDGAARVVAQDLAGPVAGVFERLGSPEAVIHLAWGGLPQYGSQHHLDQELPIQSRFLGAMIDQGLPALVVTGTCFEYGLRAGMLSEGDPLAPANPYAQAKVALHQELRARCERGSCALTWARLFYLHGPGQPERTLLSQLALAAGRGDDEFPMSGGDQVRDYLPVGTVATALVRLAEIREGVGTVNICSGKPVRIRDLVEEEIHRHQWRIRPAYGRLPYSAYEPMEFWGDRTTLDRVLEST